MIELVVMEGSSLVSILILLFLFVVLPSILKLLGQFTMNNRTTGEDDELPVEEDLEHPSLKLPGEKSHEEPYKPIKPKWF